MKSALAAAIAVLATAQAGFTLAQSPAPVAPATDIPPMKCEAPKMPGERMMEDTTIRKRFERDVKAYGECVKGWVSERQATAEALQKAAKANVEAGNAAVNDYNALMAKFNGAK